MRNYLSIVIRKLPFKYQTFISSWFFLYQFKRNKFVSSEVEWSELTSHLKKGDFCIDIGANVGRYALRMAEIVGNNGAVLAFEPNVRIFNILTNLVYFSGKNNITLLNAGVSNKVGFFELNESWNIPKINHYFNTNTDSTIGGNFGNVLTIRLDDLHIERRVSLIKIDIEGMELDACLGMRNMLEIHDPVIIIENNSPEVTRFLETLGYYSETMKTNTRNLVFKKHD